jgi:hypothetical protein
MSDFWLAADELAERTVPLERFSARGLCRDLTDPALERRFMASPKASGNAS